MRIVIKASRTFMQVNMRETDRRSFSLAVVCLGAGMVALVHDNTELPLIEASGLQLKPGEKHKLGYKKKTTSLLSAPYTSCTNRVSQSMEIMFDKFYAQADYGYSQTVCYQLCQQAFK